MIYNEVVRNTHPIPQWMRDAFGTVENCAPSQNGMQVFTQMRTIVQSYFESQKSDTEMLDWLAKKGYAVVDCGQSYDVLEPHYGASTWFDVDSPTPREAIKAAMREDKEKS